MDTATARALIELDTAFYRAHAESFSATRQAPWQGWRQVAELLRPRGAAAGALSVLDLACGNLRFERFLTAELAGRTLTFHAVDNCPALMDALGKESAVRLHTVDILDELLAGNDPLAGIPRCDTAVCFGFMHHVPGFELRRAVLDALLAHTEPGGVVAISFWQFMQDERLACKARATTEAHAAELPGGSGPTVPGGAALETGDYLLPWQNSEHALRYCHHFEDAEIDQLVASLPAGIVREAARFSADGRSGNLNRYLVLERTGRGHTAPN
ncbi:class I SAM-dependent methyltransferase [Enorma phocaeensis]|uniref:class I SAM-dependent methyltransferase n=1 Tax=Enorma phocaeensis TaxID=1871019 RepID=UPI000C84B11B|nr:class I SAM-dependent methyltransferase [Enorma phocaeensis]